MNTIKSTQLKNFGEMLGPGLCGDMDSPGFDDMWTVGLNKRDV